MAQITSLSQATSLSQVTSLSQATSLSKKLKSNKKSVLLEFIEEPNTNVSLYTIARSPYNSSEYIPSSIIPLIMSHYFPSSELSLSYNENHGIYKIMINDLLGDNVANWEYNRPPDMARCPDIARSFYISKKPLDTMIYLSFNNLHLFTFQTPIIILLQHKLHFVLCYENLNIDFHNLNIHHHISCHQLNAKHLY